MLKYRYYAAHMGLVRIMLSFEDKGPVGICGREMCVSGRDPGVGSRTPLYRHFQPMLHLQLPALTDLLVLCIRNEAHAVPLVDVQLNPFGRELCILEERQ
jgi:hypothetical protein